MKISKYPHFKSKQFLLGREKWSMVNRKICEGLWDFAFSFNVFAIILESNKTLNAVGKILCT
jgi:hypothetical protein